MLWGNDMSEVKFRANHETDESARWIVTWGILWILLVSVGFAIVFLHRVDGDIRQTNQLPSVDSVTLGRLSELLSLHGRVFLPGLTAVATNGSVVDENSGMSTARSQKVPLLA
jgi:hypothetical protein